MGILPNFTKSCSCFSLQKCVLCYGYIRLILCALGTDFVVTSGLLKERVLPTTSSICASFVILDGVLLAILIIACHEKKIGILKSPFVYNKVWWVLCMVLTVVVATSIVFIHNVRKLKHDDLLLGVFFIRLIIVFGLVCEMCFRTYVIVWYKGSKQSPSFNATKTSHILEVTEDENQEIEYLFDGSVLQLDDKEKERNADNIIGAQNNRETVKTQDDGDKPITVNRIEVNVLLHSRDNSVQNSKIDNDIELQVMNHTTNLD